MTMRATVSLWVEDEQALRLDGFLAFLRQETEDGGGTWPRSGRA